MAETTTLVCDECGSDRNVAKLTVMYSAEGQRPWEVDLCKRDFNALFGQLAKRGRRPTRATVRDRHSVKLTALSEDNL